MVFLNLEQFTFLELLNIKKEKIATKEELEKKEK